jgi:excinuclease ABC subunit C
VPSCILLSHKLPNEALLAEALSTKAERKVEVTTPQRGAKVGIVEHAAQNAREALARRLAESSTQRQLLEGLGRRLGLAATPRRIEVFDNSHIMGANAVGAMIVAGAEGFVKAQYRRFNIKSADLVPGDDYAMMREVLTRRVKRLLLETTGGKHAVGQAAPARSEGEAEASRLAPPQPPPLDRRGGSALAFGVLPSDPAAPASAAPADPAADTAEDDAAPGDFPNRPDLMLIDGGLGQLGVAREVLASFGLDIPVVGIAKGPERDAGREHFHIPGRAAPLLLETRDPVLYFVQRLRDEAHRFAIGAHRSKRSKALGVNPLDEIAGIGPTRKRALLRHFGSAKAVSRASREDLEGVAGISAQMAQTIYDFFHERRD